MFAQVLNEWGDRRSEAAASGNFLVGGLLVLGRLNYVK